MRRECDAECKSGFTQRLGACPYIENAAMLETDLKARCWRICACDASAAHFNLVAQGSRAGQSEWTSKLFIKPVVAFPDATAASSALSKAKSV